MRTGAMVFPLAHPPFTIRDDKAEPLYAEDGVQVSLVAQSGTGTLFARAGDASGAHILVR